MSDDTKTKFDVVVVGGGLAGLLSSVRIARRIPGLNILLVERHGQLGGRLRSTLDSEWGYGLKSISQELFNYWNQVLTEDSSDPCDLHSFKVRRQQRLGILQAGKVKEMPWRNALTEEGARVIAGAAAARDWSTVEKLWEHQDQESKAAAQALSQTFAGNKRSPSAVVVENISHLWGVPDPWSMQTSAFLNLAQSAQSEPWIGDWQDAINFMISPLQEKNLTVKTNCPIAHIDFDESQELWRIKSESGQFCAPKLIIAAPPWEAFAWLPRSYWPGELAALATKTKPASVVVLSEVIVSCDEDLPDSVLVTAEDVQVQISGSEISYQATLDFELTMQAPDVVKAIRRLKRARAKLCKAYPTLRCEHDHLALVPVGWSQLVTPHDIRYAEKLDGYKFQSARLMFCGDAYGPNLNFDKNVLGSVTSVFDAMTLAHREIHDGSQNY